MAIVATEIESIHGGADQHRLIFYRCQDSNGDWHSYGPVTTTDPSFDAESYKTTVAAKLEASLASTEIEQILGGD